MKYIVILITILIMSCQTISYNKEVHDECKSLEQLIKKSWYKDKHKDYYKYKEDFLTIIQRDYRDCILSLTQEQVFKLFGKPSNSMDKGMSNYFLSENCLNPSQQNCEILFFYYHEKSSYVFDYRVLPLTVHAHDVE